MMKKVPRVIEKEWLDLFFRLKASIVKCPYCKQESFISSIGDNICIECIKDYFLIKKNNICSYDNNCVDADRYTGFCKEC